MLVDTHAHLDFTDDPKKWLDGAKEAGVGKIICIGTSVEASKKCAELADKYSSDDLQIYATSGIHAQDGKEDIKRYGSLVRCIDELRKILDQVENKRAYFPDKRENDKLIVAVGECGFDFKSGRDQLPETRRFQEELFEAQIELAAQLRLPLVVHCRNAWEETFKILTKLRGTSLPGAPQGSTSKLTGVFHSWTGDWKAAKKALSLGFYISFSGIVTFGNAPNVQEVARKMPIARMLLETDSPFLAPHPLRGSKNEPKNVKLVAEFIAQLRNFPLEKIMSVTSENAGRLFEI